MLRLVFVISLCLIVLVSWGDYGCVVFCVCCIIDALCLRYDCSFGLLLFIVALGC